MADHDLTPEEQQIADDARRGILRGASDIDQLIHITAAVTGHGIDDLCRQASEDEPRAGQRSESSEEVENE